MCKFDDVSVEASHRLGIFSVVQSRDNIKVKYMRNGRLKEDGQKMQRSFGAEYAF